MIEELSRDVYKSPYKQNGRPKPRQETPLSPIQCLVRQDILEIPVAAGLANLKIPQSARNQSARTQSARSEVRTPKKKTPRGGSLQLKTPVA
jgi:hypothetical protein